MEKTIFGACAGIAVGFVVGFLSFPAINADYTVKAPVMSEHYRCEIVELTREGLGMEINCLKGDGINLPDLSK